MSRRLILLAVLTSLAAVPAQAGNFYLSLGLAGSNATRSSDIEGDGGGGELALGYFFSRTWSLELAGLLSDFRNSFNDVDGTLGGLSVNTRFSPLARERLQPYLKLGIGAYFLEDDDLQAGLAGAGLNLGGGAEFFLVPGFSIGLEGTWRFIDYTREYEDSIWDSPIYFDLEPDLDGTTFTGAVTFNYHFR